MAETPKAELPADDVMPMAHDLMDVIRRHMVVGGPSREKVFVALNALAIATAASLCGTVGKDQETPSAQALGFFNDALSRQCRELTGGEGGSLNG